MKKYMIYGLIFAVSLNSLAESKTQTSVDKKAKKKNAFSFKLDLESKVHGNIDEHVLNRDTGENTILTELTLNIRKKMKLPYKMKFISSTKIGYQAINQEDAYKDTKIINEDNLNLSNRKSNISQSFLLNKKISKKLYLLGTTDIESSTGHSIKQEFTTNKINYHAIDESYDKYSLGFGMKLRAAKAHTTQALYKFSEYNHKDGYTYKEISGSDDRRIHSIGLQHKIKLSPKYILSFTAQDDQIFYKDRLALDEFGLSQNTGIVEASKLHDQSFKALLNIDRKLDLTAKNTRRTDKIDNGDSYTINELKLDYNGNINKLNYKLGYSFGEKAYKSLLGDDANDKRKDILSNVNAQLAYTIKNIEGKISFDKVLSNSNSQYGELDYNIIGFGVNTNF